MLSNAPKRVELDSHVYSCNEDLTAAFDYIYNEANELIGFDFLTAGYIPETDRFFQSTFFTRGDEVTLDDQFGFQVILKKCSDFSVRNVNGIFSRVLKDEAGNVMVAIPEWRPWGKIGFEVGTYGTKVLD